MEITALINSLNLITNPKSEHYVATMSRVQSMPDDLSRSFFEHYLAEPLEHLLIEQDEFKGGAGYMVWHGDDRIGFHAREAARVLVHRVVSGENAEQAVQWLQRVLAVKEADGLLTIALWGIEVPGPIAISSDTSLLSFNDLSPSNVKDWLLLSTKTWDANPLIPFFFQTIPPAALVKRIHITPVLTRAGSEYPKRPSNQRLFSDQLDEIRLALTCIGPCAPMSAAIWFQFLNPDVQAAAVYRSVRTSHIEIVPAFHHPNVRITDPEVASIVQALLTQFGNTKKRLHIALERLNRAIRRFEVGDKSLDLAIAVETLFADNQGENTYKVALRAGLLDPDGLDSRRNTRAAISALYRIRSAVVHNGDAPRTVSVAGSDQGPSHEVVSEATEVVARLIRIIAKRGSIPDWHSFELGFS